MKVFISQPMRDKTNQEIERDRLWMREYVEDLCDGDCEIIDSFFRNAPHDANPLWFLGKSLELMSEANLVVFAPGWQEARGCRIEHRCAIEYGFKVKEF